MVNLTIVEHLTYNHTMVDNISYYYNPIFCISPVIQHDSTGGHNRGPWGLGAQVSYAPRATPGRWRIWRSSANAWRRFDGDFMVISWWFNGKKMEELHGKSWNTWWFHGISPRKNGEFMEFRQQQWWIGFNGDRMRIYRDILNYEHWLGPKFFWVILGDLWVLTWFFW